jgi:hypothetical protein
LRLRSLMYRGAATLFSDTARATSNVVWI